MITALIVVGAAIGGFILAIAFGKLRPQVQIAPTQEFIDIARELSERIAGTPHAFSLLAEIQPLLADMKMLLAQVEQQFRTDSGGSLRDIVDAITTLLTRLEAAIHRVEVGAVGDREAVALVAADLEVAQAAVEGVAEQLTASQHRADNVPVEEPPGAAADAGSRSDSES